MCNIQKGKDPVEKISGIVKSADKQKIFYDHYQGGNKAVIVIAHGFFNSRRSVLIRQLIQCLLDDFDVIAFDFRGHGESEGLFFWTTKEYLDLEAVLTFANERYKQVGLIGFSLGAATSIITLAKNNGLAGSFVSISAPTQFEKIDFQFWNLDVENDVFYNLGEGRKGKGVRPGPFWLPKDKPVAVVDRIKVPVLYIHGDEDWVVKPWHSQALYEKTTARKHILLIEKGPHAEYLMRAHEKELVTEIKKWFTETLCER